MHKSLYVARAPCAVADGFVAASYTNMGKKSNILSNCQSEKPHNLPSTRVFAGVDKRSKRTAAESVAGLEEDEEAAALVVGRGGPVAPVRVSTSVEAMHCLAASSPVVYTAARP